MVMAKIRWLNAVDGNFDTAADWSTGTVPGVGDRAVLGVFGGYTVTVSAWETVLKLHIAPDVTLLTTGVIRLTADTLFNAGTIDWSARRGSIRGSFDNTGVLMVNGDLTITKAVTGDGSVIIGGGSYLTLNSGFTENVTFTMPTVNTQLSLAQSQGYTGEVSGLSSFRSRLYLEDIGFVSSSEATYSGDTQSGILTVTDGTHTAHIKLIGDYTGEPFIVRPRGSGVVVQWFDVYPHRFIAAMAGLGGSAGGTIHADHATPIHEPMLSMPRVMIA